MSKDEKLFSEFPSVSTEAWEEVIAKDLKGADYKSTLNWQTGEGVSALPFYRRDDIDSRPPLQTPQQREWEIRQPVPAQDIGKANTTARKAIENGAEALAFTLDVQDSRGNLGNDLQGVAIQNQEAFNRLLDGIDPIQTNLHFDAGVVSPIILAMLHNECESRNIDSSQINGTFLNDPYAFTLINGQFPAKRNTLTGMLQQMATFCDQYLSGVKSLGVDARVYHNAGGTIVQELGYALAAGSEYLALANKKKLDVDTIASAIHFNFSVGSNYFLEIAKFRAFRKLWRTVLDAYEADDEHNAYLHGSSSAWNKTVYDPYVNMLRTTTEGMSAALAGCDAITLHPFDEPFRQPDSFSQRIARNTQIILKEEAYLNKVADPAAGSYYIETLTDKIAEAAWECFQEVEKQGGLLKSIENGYVQTAIEESTQNRNRAIATRKRIFVGINQYPNAEDGIPDKRDATESTISLTTTDHSAYIDSATLIASLKKALQNGCTLGDLAPVLINQKKYDVRPIHPYRGSAAFEKLRKATEQHPSTPTVLTLSMGNKRMRKARSAFAVNFFGCAGYDIEDPIGFDSIDEAISAVKKVNPEIVVLCSSDDEYEKLVPSLCSELTSLEEKPISVLAGYPKEHIDFFEKAGIDVFIHAKSNVLKTLKGVQQSLGIIENDE